MKSVFICALMYAPKQNGKAGGNQVGNDATDQKNENSGNDANDQKSSNTPPAADAPPEPPAPAEPTSEKLIEIRAKIDELLVSVTTETDRKKKLEIIGELQKAQAAEGTEIAAIKKALLDAKIQEARNAKLALINEYADALTAEQSFLNGEYAGIPEVEIDGVMQKPTEARDRMNVLSDTRKTAYDKLATVVLGSPSVSRETSIGGAKPAGGGTKSEMIEKMMRAGNTYDEILAAGAGDGTIRTVAGNIKFKKLANGTYAPRD